MKLQLRDILNKIPEAFRRLGNIGTLGFFARVFWLPLTVSALAIVGQATMSLEGWNVWIIAAVAAAWAGASLKHLALIRLFGGSSGGTSSLLDSFVDANSREIEHVEGNLDQLTALLQHSAVDLNTSFSGLSEQATSQKDVVFALIESMGLAGFRLSRRRDRRTRRASQSTPTGMAFVTSRMRPRGCCSISSHC